MKAAQPVACRSGQATTSLWSALAQAMTKRPAPGRGPVDHTTPSRCSCIGLVPQERFMTDTQSLTGGDEPLPRIEGLEPLDAAIGHLEFDREEKARLVSLILAIQYHVKTIISDADYLKVMLKN